MGALQPQGGTRKSSRTYLFTVPAGSTTPLRAVLAWTDAPGRFVQNSLSLRVTLPDYSSFFGNHEHRLYQDPVSIGLNVPGIDKYNNVLVLEVPQPLPGLHRLTVLAESTAVPFQGYARTVSGPAVDQSWQPQS